MLEEANKLQKDIFKLCVCERGQITEHDAEDGARHTVKLLETEERYSEKSRSA